MEGGLNIQAEMDFRGTEVSVSVEVGEDLLVVEVSDLLTADQWRGEFHPAYIEDLTRKTGNFKQFAIFCSMLESAVRKTSESVSLDLLTYGDLELLRNRKAGLLGRPRAPAQSPALHSKRYLILIYSVEFDRIHYPLPLPYLGKPDPAALQREIRALRAELAALGTRTGKDARDAEIRRLRAELSQMREEKEVLARALECLQAGGPAPRDEPRGAQALKEVVRSLEEELLRERARNQRSASKKSQEQRLLLEKLEELKASERNLRVRVKSLTSELAIVRKGRVTPVGPRRSGSELGSGPPRREAEGRRSVSRDRSLGSYSGSRERSVGVGERSGSRDRGRRSGSAGTRPFVPRQSPSPAGTRAPRFDPTAYIKGKERRQREAQLKTQRKVQRDMLTTPTSSERGRARSRETRHGSARLGLAARGRGSSVESQRSRQSSASSLADLEDLAKPLPSSAGIRSRKKTQPPLCSVPWNSPGMPPRGAKPKRQMSSTPTRRSRVADKENSFDPGADLSEIDARLQALQDYMRNLETGH
ncbi:centrosomal protein CCDC61 isoform X2 [Lepisosteus oculatus]|uniref:Centrosomal protein CCDC61 n=1 Tax=Lepisosteus oculatus TaxID=7918 RepID=W5NBV5_LEPOC|nr:PREDICTED: coiled-coil domain-containing protein 61 [Lepisosteus oculatus]XP_015196377.1 PREDICTED: coiled-coil domain-containing protein 61 [Lepisosteus oculatus]